MDNLKKIPETLIDFLQFSRDYLFIIFIVLFCFLLVLYKNEIITLFQHLFSKQHSRMKPQQKYSPNQSEYESEHVLKLLNKRIDNIEKQFNLFNLQIEKNNNKLSNIIYDHIDNTLNENNKLLNNSINQVKKTNSESIDKLEQTLIYKVTGKMDKVEIESKFKQAGEDLSQQRIALEERIMVNERLLSMIANYFSISRREQFNDYLKKAEDMIQSNPALLECKNTFKRLSVFYELHRSIPAQRDIYIKDIKNEIRDALNLGDSKSHFIFIISSVYSEFEELKNERDFLLKQEREIKSGHVDITMQLNIEEQFSALANRMSKFEKNIQYIDKNRKQFEILQTEAVTELFQSVREALLDKLRERLPKLREENTQPDILEHIDRHLQAAGIERIPVNAGVTFFNDHSHIAVDYTENTGLDPKTIVTVIKDGFIVDHEIWERAEVITARS